MTNLLEKVQNSMNFLIFFRFLVDRSAFLEIIKTEPYYKGICRLIYS